jgi:polyhydroxyalkanoate synthesis regulator phasin
MTSKERRLKRAWKYRGLARECERLAELDEEERQEYVPLEEIPRDQSSAWYREQAEMYRAKEEQERALAALEYEVAETTRLSAMPSDRRDFIKEMKVEGLEQQIRALEEQLADLKAELQFWRQV